MTTDDLSLLDVFTGELTVNRAVVYARLPRPIEDTGLTLCGQVRGPRCLHAETLPLSAPLVDLGPGPTLLAGATLPDPCFWSPDLPAIYDVSVHLMRGTDRIDTARREIGLRSLGVRGRHLALEAKRFVVRGVTDCSTTAVLARDWHFACAAYVGSYDEERLAEASQWGALVVVEFATSPRDASAALRSLALHPAVAIVVAGDLPHDLDPKSVAPNVLVFQRVEPPDDVQVQPWASGLWASADDLGWLGRLVTRIDRPIIAVRRLPEAFPIDVARAGCDLLQRDLAPLGQFAGYVV